MDLSEAAARRLTRTIAIAAAIVLALGYLAVLAGRNSMLRQFHLDAELSLPSWFSSTLMIALAVTMLRISALERNTGLSTARGWRALGFIFIYLSIDEAISLHETFSDAARAFPNPFGLFHFKWVVVGLAAVAAVALSFLPFLFRLPRVTATRLVIAGAVYVTGALGFEMVGGAITEATHKYGPSYYLAVTAEETMEILGLVLCARCVLLHLSTLGRSTSASTAAPGPTD